MLWLRRLDEWACAEGVPGPPADRVVDRFAQLESRVGVPLGDLGAGRGIQNAVEPVLLAAAGDTDLAVACGDIGAPAGGLRSYEERLLAPYADYPAPIYGAPGPVDWHDGLAGFMTVFCDAPPDARAPLPATTGPVWARAVRRMFWRRAPTATAEELAAAAGIATPRPAQSSPARTARSTWAAAARAGRHRPTAGGPCSGRWLRAVSADDGRRSCRLPAAVRRRALH